ncbi:MAG: phosphoribosylformylglycinamidine cyclo-ligase [Actinomycetota bacterium]|nr:phosphoribosylformylglycinamidine cyclo-ligase [Actinomycetota bacterium]
MNPTRFDREGKSSKDSRESATYSWSGVNIDAASEAVRLIREKVSSTMRPGVLSGPGGFASMFEIDLERYRNPVIVSGTDGVGTKLKIAQMLDIHDTVGIDLVAMCADDVVTCGAEPIFFQDYIATGKVVPEKIAKIVGGIADGCKEAGCALTGGEIAEHPGVMGTEEYDLAGFCAGVVEKDKIIDGSGVKPEDRIIGLLSSGLHSNGFSLVRKLLIESGEFSLDDQLKEFGFSLGKELLIPSMIYTPAILKAIHECEIKAIAHITGGGITENLPRVIPSNVDALINLGTWPVKNIFTFIQRVGGIDLFEMLRTFNMGLGMIVVVSPAEVRKAISVFERNLYRAFEVGEIIEGAGKVQYR